MHLPGNLRSLLLSGISSVGHSQLQTGLPEGFFFCMGQNVHDYGLSSCSTKYTIMFSDTTVLAHGCVWCAGGAMVQKFSTIRLKWYLNGQQLATPFNYIVITYNMLSFYVLLIYNYHKTEWNPTLAYFTTSSNYHNWLVVWDIRFIFPYIGNVIIPTVELHHVSEG